MTFALFLAVLWGFSQPTHAFPNEVAITMDDFNIHETTLFSAKVRNQKILGTLNKHHAKAALFVVGDVIQNNDDLDLLRQWGEDGHLIGNHTFSHHRYDAKVTLTQEEGEILRCENVIKDVKGFEKLFRFPMLAEGDTKEKRDLLREWLKDQGYKVGSVTIDASDWYIDQRMRDKLKLNPRFDLTKFRDYYLNHIWERAQYYNQLAKKVLGRQVRHTLLIHYNLLNALFLDDLLSMFESHGWKIIDAKTAFQDPVFLRLPNSMPSGQSLIWGLAKETGLYDKQLRYPGEDDVYEKPKLDALGL